MKRFYSFLALVLMTGMLSCKKNDNSDMNVKPVTVSFKFNYDTETASLGLSLEKIQVKLTNLTTSQVYNAVTGTDGVATFKDLTPGNYDINSSQTITAAEYNEKAGTNLTEAIVFNATLTRQSLTKDEQHNATLKTSRVGDLVIKQVYYSGSNVSKGASFRDQFVEIYNNSSEVIYADSLYFGQVQNVSTAATKVDQSKGYYLTGGQYNWTKSVGMNNTKANTDYVYMTSLFMIQGTGKQYPIAPGKSIIIAATAINHASPYTGADGKTISVLDPSLTIDLSKADFEVYLGDQEGINPLASDIDNPSVPNLKVIRTGGNRDLVIDALGRDGLVIFRTNEDPKKWPSYPTPDVTQIIATTKLFTQVPVNLIIDGVGLQHAIPASRVPKYMNDTIDAGETFVTAGAYQSQSVVRKTSKTINGRIVLKDSNNSSNDFSTLSKADASKSASSFIN